jgi:glycopeptide antibiotics resistance protein
VTIELLDSLLDTWTSFLESISYDPAYLSHDRLQSNARKVSHEWRHVKDFARATKEIIMCSEAAIESIGLITTLSENDKTILRDIEFEKRLLHKDTCNAMNALEQSVERLLTRTEQAVSQQQNLNIKRLTILSAIFLPLTTACSLLSMSTRVNELGALWWDWLGIVVAIAIVIFTVWRANDKWCRWRNRWIDIWDQTPFHDLWARARNTVLHHESLTTGHRIHGLIPLATSIAFVISKYLLIIGTIVSFLIGMFLEVSQGARALGYSVAIAFGSCLLIVGIWRLNGAMKWYRHRAAKKRKQGNHHMASAKPFWKRLGEEFRRTVALFQRNLRQAPITTILGLIFYPIVTVVTTLIWLFVGDLPARAVVQFEGFCIEIAWPEMGFDLNNPEYVKQLTQQFPPPEGSTDWEESLSNERASSTKIAYLFLILGMAMVKSIKDQKDHKDQHGSQATNPSEPFTDNENKVETCNV